MNSDEEFELRSRIIIETESWLGTPFHHEARLKGIGVDCGQLLIAVYSDLNLMPPIQVDHYPRDFALHRDEEWYLGLMNTWAKEFEGPPLPGDVVLFKMGRLFSHGAIVTDWPNFIHAWTAGRMVKRGRADLNPLAERERKFFSYFEKLKSEAKVA